MAASSVLDIWMAQWKISLVAL